MADPHTLTLDFHGVVVEVTTDDEECRALVERDFSMFRVQSDAPPPRIRVAVSRREPPYGRIPPGTRAWIRTKDAGAYHTGGQRYLDSYGEVLVVLDFAAERAEIYSEDPGLLHEKSYLMVMSRVGEWLDRRGLHRIHAMGVVRDGRAVLCLMPMGGGKTTLALGLMEHPGFRLLSEEAPLVSRDGRLHPLPIRLGVTADTSLSIPDEFLTPFHRRRHGPKTLIDARYFADRIAGGAEPGILLVGERSDGAKPELRPIGRLRAFRALWQMGVRAQGIPQLLEYVLRLEPRAVLAHAGVIASRTLACWRLMRRSECYSLRLGHDREANAALVAELASARAAEGCDGAPA